MPTRPPAPTDSLARCRRLVLAALVLLAFAGFRHHLFWGQSYGLLHVLSGLEAACLGAFAVLAACGWWRGMAVAERQPLPLRSLLALSLPILLLAIVVPPFLTTDPVDYVVRGRVMALHGGNPYVQVATDYPDDPFLAFGDHAWKSFPLPYGPVVANLQAGIAWLAHLLPLPPRGELIAALVLCKLLFGAALVASAWAFARVAERLRAGSGARAFVAVLWNPLLLCECLANAHNESLVLVCLAVATMALLGERLLLAAVALGLGVMTKVVPVLLLPLWSTFALRRWRLLPFAAGLGIAALVGCAFVWQFGDLAGAVAVLGRQSELRGASVWWAVHEATGCGVERLVTVGRAGVVAWIVWSMWRLWRQPTLENVVFGAASSLLMLAVFGAPLFGAWYHAWWIPFALLLERGFLFRCACMASILSPLAWFTWAATRRHDDVSQWNIVLLAVVVPVALAALGWPRAPVAPRA